MSAIARKTNRPLRRRNGAACALAAAAVAAAPGVRADVKISPRIVVEQAYTDNVRGAPRGEEEGDFFTTVAPGVNVRSIGGRFEGALDYTLTAEEYFDTDELGGFSNNLLATSRAELWEERLFFDAGASLQRVAANRRGAISATGRDVGQNQTEVLNLRGGPTLRLDFSGQAISTTTYNYSQTILDPIEEAASADATNFGTRPLNIGDTTTHTFSQRVESGRDFTRLRWNLTAVHDETERDDDAGTGVLGSRGGSFRQRSLIGGAEYAIDRTFTVLGSAGYEDIDDESITREDVSGPVYSIGGRISGSRSSIRLEVGQRFGDTSYSADAQYKFSPFLTFNSFYSEAVTTQSRLGQSALDSIIVDANGDFIDPRTGLPFQPNDPAFDLTDEDNAFKTRTFGNGLVGTRGRNTYALSAFRTERESLNVDRTEIVTGGTARIGRKLWPKLSGNVSASYTDTQDDVSGDQVLVRLGASLQYSLADDLSSSLMYSFLDRSGDGAGGGLGGGSALDLRENIVTVRIVKTF
jgi:uncharacterized protein (PEP-CTERM system associated)